MIDSTAPVIDRKKLRQRALGHILVGVLVLAFAGVLYGAQSMTPQQLHLRCDRSRGSCEVTGALPHDVSISVEQLRTARAEVDPQGTLIVVTGIDGGCERLSRHALGPDVLAAHDRVRTALRAFPDAAEPVLELDYPVGAGSSPEAARSSLIGLLAGIAFLGRGLLMLKRSK